jgi:SAM-dependent methyltransferase
MSYQVVQGQQCMALDAKRNAAYAAALAQVITPESVVLDLGAGLGTLGLLAAQLGAKRVYLVEPEDIITVAQRIVKANGYGDRIQCLQGPIEAVTLPEPVDVIISVFTGNFLLQEDLLPSLFYARDKYLKPGGVMIPQSAVMEAVPVSAPDLYSQEIDIWSQPHMGLDVSIARNYASHSIFFRGDLDKAQYLAEPAKLMALDFHTATATDCAVETTYTLNQTGLCHGWAGWFQMQLGDRWLSTAPHAPRLHWSAAFLPLESPVEVTAGEVATFKLQRPAFGDWLWQVHMAQTVQHRSTFFAASTPIQRLKQMAPEFHPRLGERGTVALAVLSQSDGRRSVRELSQDIARDYPHLFGTAQQALQFVQHLVNQFA